MSAETPSINTEITIKEVTIEGQTKYLLNSLGRIQLFDSTSLALTEKRDLRRHFIKEIVIDGLNSLALYGGMAAVYFASGEQYANNIVEVGTSFGFGILGAISAISAEYSWLRKRLVDEQIKVIESFKPKLENL